MAPPTAWDCTVNDRLQFIVDSLDKSIKFSAKDVPGLKDLLADYVNPDVEVDHVHFIRRLLRVFKDSETDGTYSSILHKHTDDEQNLIERFLEGGESGDPKTLGKQYNMGPSLGCREELEHLCQAACILQIGAQSITKLKEQHIEHLADSPVVQILQSLLADMRAFTQLHQDELEGAGILVYYNTKFQNWGLTVENTPYLTCVPKSVKEVQLIVKFAKEQNMGEATKLPNTTALPFWPFRQDEPTELEDIELISAKPNEEGNYLVKVGAACTNERLRQWCIENRRVTLPMNVIMVEITMGGSNAPICHGAGRRHKTLSDIVRRIDYVDANGEARSVTKPEHLRAASGAFGLMGVVTHITFEMPPMTYAQLNPKTVPVTHAIPPPPDLDETLIPPVLLLPWKALSTKEKRERQLEFERQATNDYYSEWFWFPYSQKVWVNCWNDTTDSTDVVEFPDNGQIFLSFVQSVTMNILQNADFLKKLIDLTDIRESVVTLISLAGTNALPTKRVTTYVPDALHFQRAIQNVRVRDMEVEIPLVSKKHTESTREGRVDIDYATVQRAWWDAILLAYANIKDCPMSMPLEMRIMGGSDIIMAPQRHNQLGTCAIEILTLQATPVDKWVGFAQQVLDKWMSLKDPRTQKPLRVRPHWAKEWEKFQVNGKPWLEKLMKEDYKAEIEEFRKVLAEIGSEAGWGLKDLQSRFSNEVFDTLIFDKVQAKRSNRLAKILKGLNLNRFISLLQRLLGISSK
ncbi:L-gulono-1,4-lactone dehydrogenase [Colletotrichum sp. SAR 10_70]|nr:L-gulono-1,4-lactone dehydrogenase [Colletotrichum sp. SAR 10_71]KAI8190389.1 L-gulono-1,4-lactone dehydrogenase [Colletotrichum sp. SAR 10_70]KAI8232965.1 L-gulono-1,4-lactone dehydrogenase [Colletotrichum sp. SAR 10_86]KAJ5001102.1 L-gulono-1,4-lactone dehydrogenase [Colletotrichum sp. SAR 10_66]